MISHSRTLAGLQLATLPQPSECCDYRCLISCLINLQLKLKGCMYMCMRWGSICARALMGDQRTSYGRFSLYTRTHLRCKAQALLLSKPSPCLSFRVLKPISSGAFL